MAYRYFSSEILPADDILYPAEVLLTGDEAHHLIHVMRVKEGEPLVLFDGSGAEFDTIITSVKKKDLTAEIRSRRVENRESSTSVSLAAALPKGERQRWLVEKLVELGAAAFLPLEAERSVAKAGEAAAQRMERVVVEAAKQCGRNTLMNISEPVSSKTLFSTEFTSRPENISTLKIIAQPGAETLPQLLARTESQRQTSDSSPAPLKILAAIGPEGGFSDAEISSALASGWIPVSLGKRILRTETAAIMICAVACGD